MSRPGKTTSEATLIFGDAIYQVKAEIDLLALLRFVGKRAAWSKSGKASALGGAVVVTARQRIADGGRS